MVINYKNKVILSQLIKNLVSKISYSSRKGMRAPSEGRYTRQPLASLACPALSIITMWK